MNKLNNIEITVSVGGKIPRRSFENYAPQFSVTEKWEVGELDEAFRLNRQKALHSQCEDLFTKIRDQIMVDEVSSVYKNLGFLEGPDGKKYPRVSSILNWDKDFYISPDELAQYGCRGTAIHDMANNWVKTKEWTTKIIHPRDAIILKNGSLRLWDTLESVNFPGFMEKHGKDIVFDKANLRGFNKEHFYTGELDYLGTWKGKPAIFDFKTREIQEQDFAQMASYARLDGIKVDCLVGIPLNPKNKSGFGNPVEETDIDKHFNIFLRYRNDFKQKFGI